MSFVSQAMSALTGAPKPKPKAADPISAAPKPGSQPKEPEPSEQDEESFIKSLNEALNYDGFDVNKVRNAALGIFNVKSIMTLIIAYIKLGNSIATKIQKNAIVDKVKAGEVLKLMKASGIQIKATGASQLSLPRLAIAFAGIVIHLRHKLKLPSRVVTSTPPDYQDLCLNGYVNLFPQAEDFIVKFNWVLTQASNKKLKAGVAGILEADSKAKLESFRAIAVAGQVLDPKGVKVLQSMSLSAAVSNTAELYGFTGGFTLAATVNESGVLELKKKLAEKASQDSVIIIEETQVEEVPITQLGEPLVEESTPAPVPKVRMTTKPVAKPQEVEEEKLNIEEGFEVEGGTGAVEEDERAAL